MARKQIHKDHQPEMPARKPPSPEIEREEYEEEEEGEVGARIIDEDEESGGKADDEGADIVRDESPTEDKV